ncbi:MAG: DUF309 domain-containing protein [Nitrospirota bacterium]
MNTIGRGIELFNNGDYFEAHEEWEEEWLNSADPERKRFIQGMIMIAAALHHYKRKELRGTERLLERGLGLLKGSETAAVDLDKQGLIHDAERFARALAARGEGIPGSEFPRIRSVAAAERM